MLKDDHQLRYQAQCSHRSSLSRDSRDRRIKEATIFDGIKEIEKPATERKEKPSRMQKEELNSRKRKGREGGAREEEEEREPKETRK